MVICCVPFCPNKRKLYMARHQECKYSFHRFPSTEPKRTQWIRSLRISEHFLINIKDSRVCSIHFDPSDYIIGGNVKKLKKIAVPKVGFLQYQDRMCSSSKNILIIIRQEPVIDTELYRCYQCKYFTKSPDSLKTHLLRHSRWEVFNCGQNTVEEFTCEACLYSTHLRVCWKEHQETHRTEPHSNFELNIYACHKCSFQTFSALIWWKHLRECSIKLTSSSPQLNCDQCNYKTHKEHSLKNHTINEHLPDKVKYFYKCDRCQYGSYNVNCLEGHIRITHKPEEYKKWFKCAQCDYKSKHDFHLQRHIWEYHLKKRYSCSKCDYKTNSGGNFNKHRLHEHIPQDPIQWFGCDQCDFKSSSASNVKRHKRCKHEDFARWFRCDQCEFTTENCRVLEQHKCEEHRESVGLFCVRCDFKANSKVSLKNHVNLRHVPDGEARWFQCGQCKFRTKGMYSFQAHRRKSHPRKLTKRS